MLLEHAASTYRNDLQHGRAVWTCGMDIWYGHAAWIYGMDMYHGHAAWTCSREMWHVHAAKTLRKDLKYGHAGWTCMYIYMFCSPIHGHICIYVYILIWSKNFVSFRFAKFLTKISLEKKTWLWQNEISAKFHEISFHDETETTLCENTYLQKFITPG